jgi:hypothetical protein
MRLSIGSRVALKRLGILAVCILAAGPIIFCVLFIKDAVVSESLGRAIGDVPSLGEFLRGCVRSSALALPTLVVIAIGMRLLGKYGWDSFPVAIVTGTVLAYAIISAFALAVFGEAPGFSHYQEANVRDAMITVAVGASLSALYWILAVRSDRRRRELVKQNELALRAME